MNTVAVHLKSAYQIARLRDSGRLVAETYEMLREHVVPGVTTAELDRLVEGYIRGRGATPVYKGYNLLPVKNGHRKPRPFPASICVAINDVICHGIPSDRTILQDGDIIGIDIGVSYNGWVGDSCVTFPVGAIDPASRRLLDTTELSLALAIRQALPGNRLGDIGAAIQQHAEQQGFSVVRDYVGHGVGRALHEAPNVMHHGERGTGDLLQVGMVFTIEPMLNIGSAETETMRDGWTVRTKDRQRSAQFEHMIAITDRGPEILTVA